jgi:hypothetical protein
LLNFQANRRVLLNLIDLPAAFGEVPVGFTMKSNLNTFYWLVLKIHKLEFTCDRYLMKSRNKTALIK